MAYEYLEHQADIGIRAWGRDYPEALAEAIRALAAVMVKPEGVKAVMELSARAEAPARDLLAVELLNEVLSLLGLKRMALADVGPVEVSGKEGSWRASTTIRGETMDPARHELGTEVKAATYSGLRLTEEPGRITFQCLLDI
jgi:SHS2 domain-containing protein